MRSFVQLIVTYLIKRFPVVQEPTCSSLCVLKHAISHSPKTFISAYIFVTLRRQHGTGFS